MSIERVIVAAMLLAAGGPVAAGDPPLVSKLVADASSGLVRPVFATHAPGDTTRLYVVEKSGLVKVVNLKSGAVQAAGDAFLDIESMVVGGGATSERGLLGLAFHPAYEENGFFYVTHTAAANAIRVVRFQAGSADATDVATATLLLTIDQPDSNHNGGWLGFDPVDGLLHLALGDGGSSCNPGETAQDLDLLLGKILRLDVDGDFPYAIPPDNPFVGVAGADEIWSYGLRNPWRASFDRSTGDLIFGDVGQFTWEEVNFQPASSAGGENYGWDCTEGPDCPVEGCDPGACTCGAADLIDPIHTVVHPTACAVVGGYVYRGVAIPELSGTYFYANYCNARLWSFRYDGDELADFVERTDELEPAAGTIEKISSFGEDQRGELYVCEFAEAAEVYRISPAAYTVPFTDVNGDLVVDVQDLLTVILSWGECVGCAADTNGDDVVDVADLIGVVVDWGAVR